MPSPLPPGVTPDSPLGQLLTQVHELISAGRFSDAIEPMSEAIALTPNQARLWTNLGGLFIETGETDRAREALEIAIALNPRMAIAHWQLGIALQTLGDPEHALRALEEAVRIRPDLADAHIRLTSLYTEAGRRLDAIAAFRLAAMATGAPDEKAVLEAQAYRMEGREAEAETSLRSALEQNPDSPTAHGFLAQILAESGRFDEATQHFEAQLARSPTAGIHYYDLVRNKKITTDDHELLQRMDAALELQMDDMNRALVLLARGKALDDLGRYQEAMRSLDEASELRSRAFALDIRVFEKQVDDIIALFSADLIANCSSGNGDRTPVLIVGMPRSGTTLVEQIISSHPDAVGTGELVFWRERLNAVLRKHPPALTKEFLSAIAEDCLAHLRRGSGNATRVSDKNPFNFLAVGLIHMAFPKAAIVHCRRHPVDTSISIHQIHFSRSTGIPTGGEDLVRYYRAYQRLMEHWRRVLPDGRMLELEYETLTTSPHTEIRRLIDYVGLPWNASCLAPHVNNRLIRTPSGWQVRQSINTFSVARWRHYESWLGPLAALLEEADRR